MNKTNLPRALKTESKIYFLGKLPRKAKHQKCNFCFLFCFALFFIFHDTVP